MPTTKTTSEFQQGYKIGLSPERNIRYISNPYDRRKRTGKDWEAGREQGTKDLCSNGREWADSKLVELR